MDGIKQTDREMSGKMDMIKSSAIDSWSMLLSLFFFFFDCTSIQLVYD